jgi:glyoxylate reductase
MGEFVYITREVPEITRLLLRQGLPGARIETNPHNRNLSPGEITHAARGAGALICTLADAINAPLLAALAPPLRVVATFAVGTNNIDLAAARKLGVIVANTPGVLTNATAEVAVGLILACARRFGEGERMTRGGGFEGWAPTLMRGHGVYGKTVGIIGAGRIGLRVARTMRAGFDCPVLYASRSARPQWDAELGARHAGVDQLLAESDIVSLHCPLTPETRHLLDARRLALMKPTAVLVNTARGPVIDEAALVAALRERRIAAAGLDVYEDEPALAPGLSRLENVVLLPHVGSATMETRDEMGRMCAQAVIDVLQGRVPANIVPDNR